jgi:UDP-N-acetylglucosamine 2-epimerase (non-hydrolysing)
MKNILFVFGTRPEAIKMAPLIKELKLNKGYNVIVCVTAQHREMLDQVLKLFDIKPDYDLDIMRIGQDLYDVTSRVLLGMREVLNDTKPDLVLVHGDTSTSSAAALAAFYKQIPVGHIEAGLRTYNIYSPWPEEMNRQMTSRIAKFHFAPTLISQQNLLKEGIDPEKIYVTGNTVIDSLYWVLNQIEKSQSIKSEILNTLETKGLEKSAFELWKNGKRKLILITGHRRENFGQGFIDICEAIKELSDKYPEIDFVYPMHLNPNVRLAIDEVFGIKHNNEQIVKNVYFIEPVDYLPFVYLMNCAYLVLTDSGGIQEEAPSLGIPVLVMRNTTERPEAVTAGTVKLVGSSKCEIITNVSDLVSDVKKYNLMAKANNPYGDGLSSKRICEILSTIYVE